MTTATMRQVSVNTDAVSPEDINSVLLSDGKWHEVQNCKLTHFAVSEAHSPIYPDKLYPYLTFDDMSSNKKNVKVPFRQIVAIETKQ